MALGRIPFAAGFLVVTCMAAAAAQIGCAAPRYSGAPETQTAIVRVIDQGEDVREVLLPRVKAGTATLNETRLLQAVCANLADSACLAECVTAARTAELPPLEPPTRMATSPAATAGTVRVVLEDPSERW
jgi:hypothetical protein